jgi:hypothetical protein
MDPNPQQLKQLIAESKSKVVVMSMMDFARFLDSLPPAPPVIPITNEQMEQWFQPWEIIIDEDINKL